MIDFIDYLLGGLASGAVIALLAVALVVTWRATRVVNFAQVGQAMFTTFIALTLENISGSWWVALIGAMIAGAILGVIVQFLVLRPVARADTSGAIIATFGVLIALQSSAAMIWGGDSQSFPQPFSNESITLFGHQWLFSVYDLIVIGVAAVMVIGLTLLFTRTNLGLAMRATAFNPEVAKLSGVRVGRTLTIGWALAGVVGAVAGVLTAGASSFISPITFDVLLVFAFTAAVIGGLDSLVGAVSMGVGTGVILALVTGYSDSANAPVISLILLAVTLLLNPGGLFGHNSSRSV